jgi:cell division protein FtsB
MKSLVVGLIVLFLLLQYKLWFEDGGVGKVWRLRNAITTQTTANNELKHQNEMLEAEISDLKRGQEAVEEHARNDLGMIKKDERYYQIIEK